jgi:hypothetical protein
MTEGWRSVFRHVDADGDISQHSAERPLHYGRGDKQSAAMQRSCGRTGQPWRSACARVSRFRHCEAAKRLRQSRRDPWQSQAVGRVTEWRTATEPWSATRSLGRFFLSVMSLCPLRIPQGRLRQVQVLRLRSLRHASRTRTKSQVQRTKQLVVSSPSCRARCPKDRCHRMAHGPKARAVETSLSLGLGQKTATALRASQRRRGQSQAQAGVCQGKHRLLARRVHSSSRAERTAWPRPGDDTY